jgi:hypothetical protein
MVVGLTAEALAQTAPVEVGAAPEKLDIASEIRRRYAITSSVVRAFHHELPGRESSMQTQDG